MYIDLAAAAAQDAADDNSDTVDSSAVTKHHIRYPSGFSPQSVDATEPKYKKWCDSLMQQKISKFSCLEGIKRHIPLDGDPLLDIRIKKDHHTSELKNRFIKTPDKNSVIGWACIQVFVKS